MITEEPLIATEPMTLAERRAFMKLPLAERRRQLAAQADLIAAHYEAKLETAERQEWQGGDLVEYYCSSLSNLPSPPVDFANRV